MPQRTTNFWLLLAATISVDAVVFYWMASELYPAPVHVSTAFHALVVGQISIVCIWSGLSLKRHAWIYGAPWVAAALTALVTALLSDKPVILSDSFPHHFSYFGVHVALLLAAFWLLQRTPYWRRKSGAEPEWRYSVAHLLIVMTIAAVLAAAMRRNLFFVDGLGINIVFLCSSLALAIFSTIVWSLSWHWFLRLAAVLGIAILLGLVFLISSILESTGALNPRDNIVSLIIGTNYLIQAVVISSWLACAPILPAASITLADEALAQRRP